MRSRTEQAVGRSTSPDGAPLRLECGAASAVIRPDEGGSASELVVSGASVLARTPWADDVIPSSAPADDEETWVQRWRGGWQLCFPTAGQPDPSARPRQGFHGAASQAPWVVLERTTDAVTLEWHDEFGLGATRRWSLAHDSLEVTTTAANRAVGRSSDRMIAVAEHLILGGDLLTPVIDGGAELRIEAGGSIAPLDYAGVPVGRAVAWPGDDWDRVGRATPARVAALVGGPSRTVSLIGPELAATVSWDGLPCALLWEELARSTDQPWNGEVVALGVEPTSTPHGAGTAAGVGLLALRAGESATWSVRLQIRQIRRTARREESP